MGQLARAGSGMMGNWGDSGTVARVAIAVAVVEQLVGAVAVG